MSTTKIDVRPTTVGAPLERDRLRRRARQLELAVDALGSSLDRARRRPGGPPGHLHQALAELQAERRHVVERLRALGAVASTGRGRPSGTARARGT
jgi:hypothetical protein